MRTTNFLHTLHDATGVTLNACHCLLFTYLCMYRVPIPWQYFYNHNFVVNTLTNTINNLNGAVWG